MMAAAKTPVIGKLRAIGKVPAPGPLPQVPPVPGTRVVRAQLQDHRQEPAAGRPGDRAALRHRPPATALKAGRVLPTVAMAVRSHAVAVRRHAVAVRSHPVAVVGPSAAITREAPQALSPAAADQAWEAPHHGRDPQVEDPAEGEEGKQ